MTQRTMAGGIPRPATSTELRARDEKLTYGDVRSIQISECSMACIRRRWEDPDDTASVGASSTGTQTNAQRNVKIAQHKRSGFVVQCLFLGQSHLRAQHRRIHMTARRMPTMLRIIRDNRGLEIARILLSGSAYDHHTRTTQLVRRGASSSSAHPHSRRDPSRAGPGLTHEKLSRGICARERKVSPARR